MHACSCSFCVSRKQTEAFPPAEQRGVGAWWELSGPISHAEHAMNDSGTLAEGRNAASALPQVPVTAGQARSRLVKDAATAHVLTVNTAS